MEINTAKGYYIKGTSEELIHPASQYHYLLPTFQIFESGMISSSYQQLNDLDGHLQLVSASEYLTRRVYATRY